MKPIALPVLFRLGSSFWSNKYMFRITLVLITKLNNWYFIQSEAQLALSSLYVEVGLGVVRTRTSLGGH